MEIVVSYICWCRMLVDDWDRNMGVNGTADINVLNLIMQNLHLVHVLAIHGVLFSSMV